MADTEDYAQGAAVLAAALRAIIEAQHAATLSKRSPEGAGHPYLIEAYRLDGAAPTSILTYWRENVGVQRATLQTIAEVVDLGRSLDALQRQFDTARASTLQAALALGISDRRVRALAASRGLALRIGQNLMFTREEIAAMRERKPGRPWPSDEAGD